MLRSLLRRPRAVKVPVENGSVDIQKVEVKRKSKAFFTQLVVRVALTYCVINTVSWLMSDDFKRRSEEFRRRINETAAERRKRRPQSTNTAEIQTVPTKDSDALVKKGDIFQLTLPVWFREREREMFKTSDPEWQSFLELQKDAKRMADLKMKVSKAVAQQLHSSSRHVRNLQYIQYRQRMGANLEIVPPIYSPETYEVPCIFVGADWKVSLGWRTLSRAASAKTERMFHPVVFSQAFFAGVIAFSTTTFHLTKARVLDQFQKPEPFKMEVSMVQRGNQKIVTAIALTRTMSKEQQIISNLPLNRVTEQQGKLTLPFLRGEFGDQGPRQQYRNLVNSMTYQDAIEHACGVFKVTWLEKQMVALQDSTNGTCSIRGFVDCMGERGRYRVEVIAFYIPSQDVLVGQPRITKHFIIPDLPRWPTKPGQTSHDAGVRNQQGVDAMPDKPPPPTTEKPAPGKDAGK